MKNQNTKMSTNTLAIKNADKMIEEAIKLCTVKPKLFFFDLDYWLVNMDAPNLKTLVSELKGINKDMSENEKFFLACSKINEAKKNAEKDTHNVKTWNLLQELLIDSMDIRNDWDSYSKNLVKISFTLDEKNPDKETRKQLKEFRSRMLNCTPIDDRLNELSKQINKEIEEQHTLMQLSTISVTDNFDSNKMEQNSDSDNEQYVFGR